MTSTPTPQANSLAAEGARDGVNDFISSLYLALEKAYSEPDPPLPSLCPSKSRPSAELQSYLPADYEILSLPEQYQLIRQKLFAVSSESQKKELMAFEK